MRLFPLLVTLVSWMVLPLTVLKASPPELAGCPLFPADNVWNTPIDHLPVHPDSEDYVITIGTDSGLKADFGSGLWNGGPIGIPYTLVSRDQPGVSVQFLYADESDAADYPIPLDAKIEGGSQSTGDRHVLLLQEEDCLLYELYAAYPQSDGSWQAGSGAIFDLRTNNLRPAGWTSADAAGLAILPGLVRYEEVAAGEINHALRFTVPQTQRAFVWPGRHYASNLTADNYPPMGLRMRLRADFDISEYSPQVQVILRALKKYGMVLSDNGSAWFITGVPDERWNNDILHELRSVPGSALEAVDTSPLQLTPDSAQAAPIAVLASGDPGGLSLSALLQPGDYLNSYGYIYLAAIWNDQILFHNGSQWIEYVNGNYPYHRFGPLENTRIILLDNFDVRPFSGAEIYAGFGLTELDMLEQHRYRMLYRVP